MTTPIGGFVADLEEVLRPPTPPTHSHSPTTLTPSPPPRMPLGAIIGGTVGGVAFAVLILCGFLFWGRRGEAQVATPPVYQEGTVDQSELSGHDWIQSPVSPSHELGVSPNVFPNPVHELPGEK